jgi:hypothetical protein
MAPSCWLLIPSVQAYNFVFSTITDSFHQVKEDEMGRECSKNGEKKNVYGIFVVKSEGKRPLGRLRRRWVDNTKMILREIGWGGMDWIDLAQDRDEWRALMNLQVP